jgi:hypothetical protein
MKRALLLFLLPACAAIGSTGAGDKDLPTSGVGPFRKLDGDETLGVAPFVLDDANRKWRGPAVLPLNPGSSDPAVILFVAGTVATSAGAREAIVRTRADDGRSFFGARVGSTPLAVVTADRAEEQARAPSAVRIGGRMFLYWSDALGIRVATSDDNGHTFAKKDERALERDPRIAWETTAPSAPSVAVYPDGRVRMLYAAGGLLGEAETADGTRFTRIDADPATPEIDPVFGPSPPVDPASLASGDKPPFDAAGVGDPCLLPRVTPAGRLHVRVLYTGTDADGATSIGFAARFGDQGRLARQEQPVYSVGKQEAGPALFEWPGGALLYVDQDRAPADKTHYPAIAAAFAPANLRLPAATAYADSP